MDRIEEAEGPGVLVTIAPGPRHFSIGFDLPYWMENSENALVSLIRFQELMARLVTFKLPSMAVINGTAIAAGYWLTLSHDIRTMDASKGNICLSELKLGMTIPFPYTRMLVAKLDPIIVTKISFSIDYEAKEALQDKLVDSLYQDPV